MLHLEAPAHGLVASHVVLSDAARDLCARLMTARSAPRALEAWCAERGLGDEPIAALLEQDQPAWTIPGETRAALEPAAGQTIRHRRAHVVCGSIPLLAADTWYLPGRLQAGMTRLLDGTDVPFELVVESLRPRRELLSLQEAEPGDPFAFRQVVLVRAGDGRPLAVIEESYTPLALLDLSRVD